MNKNKNSDLDKKMPLDKSMRHVAVIAVMASVATLCACASTDKNTQKNDSPTSSITTTTTTSSATVDQKTGDTTTVKTSETKKTVKSNKPKFDEEMGSALTSPLSDLNLTRTDIPPVLKEAYKGPYVIPEGPQCAWLATEVAALDDVLGEDVDAVVTDKDGNIVEKGVDEIGNAAVSALRSFTEGFVPFRSWVRKLTGADKHAKEVATAGMAGIVRRSYLKGIMKAKSCTFDVPSLNSPDKK